MNKKSIYTTDEKQPQGEQTDFYTNKFIGNFEIRRIFNDRPLDKVGQDDALHMGKLMKDKDIIPSYIISSTALRAKTTAELVAKGCSYQGDIVLNQSLYEAKPKDYLAIV